VAANPHTVAGETGVLVEERRVRGSTYGVPGFNPQRGGMNRGGRSGTHDGNRTGSQGGARGGFGGQQKEANRANFGNQGRGRATGGSRAGKSGQGN